MTWIRTSWTAISAGFLVFLAIFAVASARRQKTIARKWQDKSVDIEQGRVTAGTLTAKAASSQAKLHDAKADEIKAKAEKRITQIGEKDEDVKDILARWGT